MNKWKFLLFFLLSAIQLTAFASPKEKKNKSEEPKEIYMYGVSVDFNDSTVYITDIQSLDSMTINTDGSLRNYSDYSLQLKVYLEGTVGETNQTCAVIYSEKKKKLEKEGLFDESKKKKIEKHFIKMRKKYQSDPNKILKRIGTDAFTFQKR